MYISDEKKSLVATISRRARKRFDLVCQITVWTEIEGSSDTVALTLTLFAITINVSDLDVLHIIIIKQIGTSVMLLVSVNGQFVCLAHNRVGSGVFLSARVLFRICLAPPDTTKIW